MRGGYRAIVELLREQTGADDAAIQQLRAFGMLSNFIAAMDAEELDEPWTRITLVGDLVFKHPSSALFFLPPARKYGTS